MYATKRNELVTQFSSSWISFHARINKSNIQGKNSAQTNRVHANRVFIKFGEHES